MEEVYIVKLKGLPPPTIPSQDSLSKDSKTSFYYHTDLTAEAIRGFSYLHIFFGITVLCLSVTNLCFHENPLALDPPLGITVWCSIAFILLGFFGILTAYKRKCDLSGSIFYVKFQLVLIIIVLSMTLTFAILFALDMHGPIANQFIGLNIIFSIIVESVILLLTLFTCARVLWPGCIQFCAKDWPMQPSLKRKMIVKTNVFANGIQQDKANIIQSFGPNCVISLNMPPAIPSEPALSSKNSSICSSPTYKTGTGVDGSSNHKITTSVASLSGSTSDLAKSLSTIYAIPDDPQLVLENNTKEQITTIATNSIYYNYPNVGTVSTANLLQTFPTADQQNREQNAINNSKTLQQQLSSALFLADSSSNSWYRGSDSGTDEIDPYDTDEFDYCSTEEEEEERVDEKVMIDDECHKSSSDDGNGTLEEDSKSITESETSNSTGSELVTSDEGGSNGSGSFISSPPPCNKHFPPPDIQRQDQNNVENSQSSTLIEIKTTAEEDNNKVKLSSLEKTDDKIEEKQKNREQDADDDGTSGSSSNGNCSSNDVKIGDETRTANITTTTNNTININSRQSSPPSVANQVELRSFNMANKKPPPPYKPSIIKIESPINKNGKPTTTSRTQNEDPKRLNNNSSGGKNHSSSKTATTIRLLNTNKTSNSINKNTIDNNKNKSNNRLQIADRNKSSESQKTLTNKNNIVNNNNSVHNNKENSSASSASSVAKLGSKIASHPYLCKLRASNNQENFIQKYPKTIKTNEDNPITSSTNKQQQHQNISFIESHHSHSIHPNHPNHHHHHRIPDIQRV